jgi:hypothetical protein
MQNSNEMYKYKNLINQCRLIKQKDDYLAEHTGYNFNIFSILDRERYEVTTHSYFIFELLNPKGSHNQKTKFLEIFLTDVLDIRDYGDITKFYVERESLTRHNRRIDFVIECESIIIGIEMKVDAGDQHNQLYDYAEEISYRARDKKDISLYYLTLHGTDASEHSMNGLKKEMVKNISFEKDIFFWIKRCMESVVSIPILRDALNQYLILVENLTGKKESVMDEISDLLLKDDNLAVVIELEKSVEKAKMKIQKKFWELFIEQLPSSFMFVDFDFIDTSIEKKVDKYYELSNNSRYYGVKYDIVVTEEYTISYYIELHNKLYHGLTVSKRDTQGILKRAGYCDQDAFIKIREILNNQNIFDYNSSWWIVRKHFNCSNEINFYHFNEFTLQLNNSDILNQNVECLVNEVVESMVKVKTMFPKWAINL